jgi:hypothetical protein
MGARVGVVGFGGFGFGFGFGLEEVLSTSSYYELASSK